MRLRRLRFAFTLIELLVVVALIAILCAIVFPVFARVREAGRRATCLSNIRQLGMAFALYTQDHDGAFPNNSDPYLWVGKRFRWPIMPYVGAGLRDRGDGSFSSTSGQSSILRCPSDAVGGSGFDATSYGYSAAFYHTSDQINAMGIANLRLALGNPGPGAVCVTRTESDIAFPSNKILLGEFFNSHQRTGSPVGYWGTLAGPGTPGPDRWDGGRVVAFADGHAAFVQARRQRPSRQDCPDFHLTPDGIDGTDIGG